MKAAGAVRFITLGCRVNQYETQAMREQLQRAGFESYGTSRSPGLNPGYDAASGPEEIDLVVINTCTVTAEADRESRYWIRRARRDHPGARIIVTGCGVQKDRRAIEAMPGVDLVLSQEEKADIADRLLGGCASPEIQDTPSPQPSPPSLPKADPPLAEGREGSHLVEEQKSSLPPFSPLRISRSEGHTRAFVKIQDGCNHACSFCKVVLVRGRSRSRPLEDIVEEVKRLRDAGYRDVVFAGIQLGAYGLDLSLLRGRGEGEGVHLVSVLEACSRIQGIDRLRLSSIEPTDVSEPLIEALVDIPQCAHHLHIPLQSGDDAILEKMNRRYRRSFYLDLVARLKAAMSDFCLTLDVMAGFPGEEEAHFESTLEVLETVKPLRCHVFPYSRREGTRAARFACLPREVVRRRVDCLMEAARRLGDEVRSSFLGRVMPVLVEKSKSRHQGLTANFMKVLFSGGSISVGEMVPVELLSLEGEAFLGRAVESEAVRG